MTTSCTRMQGVHRIWPRPANVAGNVGTSFGKTRARKKRIGYPGMPDAPTRPAPPERQGWPIGGSRRCVRRAGWPGNTLSCGLWALSRPAYGFRSSPIGSRDTGCTRGPRRDGHGADLRSHPGSSTHHVETAEGRNRSPRRLPWPPPVPVPSGPHDGGFFRP